MFISNLFTLTGFNFPVSSSSKVLLPTPFGPTIQTRGQRQSGTSAWFVAGATSLLFHSSSSSSLSPSSPQKIPVRGYEAKKLGKRVQAACSSIMLINTVKMNHCLLKSETRGPQLGPRVYFRCWWWNFKGTHSLLDSISMPKSTFLKRGFCLS